MWRNAFRWRSHPDLAREGEVRMTLDQLGALGGQSVPGGGHFQELVALLADDTLGERTAFFRVLAVFGGFFHDDALLRFRPPASGRARPCQSRRWTDRHRTSSRRAPRDAVLDEDPERCRPRHGPVAGAPGA